MDAALNACASFLSSLPPRVPRALPPPPASTRPAHLLSAPKPVNAAALYPLAAAAASSASGSVKAEGEEDEEEDEPQELDVERLSLPECLDLLDTIEAENVVSDTTLIWFAPSGACSCPCARFVDCLPFVVCLL